MSFVKERDSAVDREQRTILSVSDFKMAAMKYMSDLPYEVVCIYALNSNGKIIGFTSEVGDTNQCVIYVKNVFRFLLSSGAAGFIIAHNHPGESKQPSTSDWTLTKTLKAGGRILNIEMLDHIIIAGNEAISMRSMPRWQHEQAKLDL